MKDERLEKAQREIAGWTRRAPRRSPATARQRIASELEAYRGGSGVRPWKLVAATVVVTAVGSAVVVLRPDAPTETRPAAPRQFGEVAATPSLVVYELESGTKIYVSLPGAGGVEQGSR